MTGMDSERFLIDDWGDLLHWYTFSALRQDLRFRHVLDRATWTGKNSMFTQGFVRPTSSWVGTSSAQ